MKRRTLPPPGRLLAWVLALVCTTQIFACASAGQVADTSSTYEGPTESLPSDEGHLMASLEEHGEVLRAGLDDMLMSQPEDDRICESACNLRDQICELSSRICEISVRNPGYDDVALRCDYSVQSCVEADTDVIERCGCPYLPPNPGQETQFI